MKPTPALIRHFGLLLFPAIAVLPMTAQGGTLYWDSNGAAGFGVCTVDFNSTFRQTGGTINVGGNAGYGHTFLETGINPSSGTAKYIMNGGTLKAARIGVANGNGNGRATAWTTSDSPHRGVNFMKWEHYDRFWSQVFAPES